MMYRRLCKGVNDFGTLIPSDQSPVPFCLENPNTDIYTSIFKYNNLQHQQFKNTGSIAGITNLISEKLVWDFDSKDDPKLAQEDAKTLCEILEKNEVSPKAIRIAFSSNKGFHVEVKLTENVTVDEFKAITHQLANGLESFDKVVCNPSRIFRVLGSFNIKSHLYKIPLTRYQLLNFTIEEVRNLAKTQDTLKGQGWTFETIDLPSSFVQFKSFKKDYNPKVKIIDVKEIDWSTKPKWLTNCRYSLQEGYFGEGMRNTAFTCLAATMKNQGFKEEHTYRYLKGVAELQATVNSCDRYPDELIYNNVITQVYSSGWKNGQYSCRDIGSPLQEYCLSLGANKCKHREDESTFIEIEHFADKFTTFATTIEANTLKFGIKEIDNNVLITTSMVVALLGAPSAGKTTLLFNFLEQSNKDNIDSVFFSMDMGLPLVYLRLIQRQFGYSKEKVFDIWKHDQKKMMEIIEIIKDKYKYTKFSFKTGLNVEGMREATLDHEQRIGRPVKLVGVDYLERVRGPYSDATANSGQVANELTDFANDTDKCVMLLTQTQKNSGDPSDPLLSMRNIKGASLIEQSASAILTLSRPGFSPTEPENDKFATVSLVKGRMDTLFTKDLSWNGLRGSFGSLADEDRQLLFDVRSRKAEEKKQKSEGWG